MAREYMIPMAKMYAEFYGFELRLTPEGRIRARAMPGRSAPVDRLDWIVERLEYVKAALIEEGDYDALAPIIRQRNVSR